MDYIFSNQFRAGRIDKTLGVINDVSVISLGEARGHSVWCDSTTLEQVHQRMTEKRSGTKVKLNHASSIGDTVGKLTMPRIEGTQLKADFHLLNTSPHRELVLEMAQEIPESVGMSISFSGDNAVINGKNFARCERLHSVDLVDAPAANPGGLFSAGRGDDKDVAGVPVLSDKEFYKLMGDERNPVCIHSITSGAQFCGMARTTFSEIVHSGKVKPVGSIQRGGQRFFVFRQKDLNTMAKATATALSETTLSAYQRLAGADPRAAMATLAAIQEFKKQ